MWLMLDPALFRDDTSDIDNRLDQRGDGFAGLVSELRRLDAERRAIIPVLEEARHAKKMLGAKIGEAKRAGEAVGALMTDGEAHAATIETYEGRRAEVDQARDTILLKLPNLAHESVPMGSSEADNVEVRRHGEPMAVDFEAKSWHRMIEINMTSVFYCMKYEIRQFLKQDPRDERRGAIVNTSSGAGIIAAPGQPHYTAAKHGV